MPTGTFSFLPATTFPLIAKMPCGATVHTLPQTSSQVMPAVHRHICSRPQLPRCSTPEMEGEGERDRVREGESVWVVSGGKKTLCCSAKKVCSEEKNTEGTDKNEKRSCAKEQTCKIDDLNSSGICVMCQIESGDKLISA